MKRLLLLLLMVLSTVHLNAQIDTEPTNNNLPGDLLGLGTNTATISGSSDFDYFRVNLSGSGVLTINVAGTNANMKTRVEVINPDGLTSEGYRDADFTSANVNLEILTQSAGIYFIKVRNINATANSSPYILNVSLDTADVYEFNNDLDALSAVAPISLSLNENIPNSIQGRIQGYYRTNFSSVDSNNFAVLSADVDLYKVTTNGEQGVIVMELENVPSNLKFRIDVIKPDAASSTGYTSLGYRDATTTGEPLTFELLTTFAGDYYIKISNVNGELNGSATDNTSASPYTMNLWLDTTGNEYDNTIGSMLDNPALSLPLDQANAASLQGKIRGYYRTNYTSVDSNNFAALSADVDLYKVTTNGEQGVIVMELENVPSNLKFRIDVVKPDAASSTGYTSLGYRDATGTGEPLTFELLTTFAGDYYIKISNVNGQLNASATDNTSASPYTLNLWLDTTGNEYNNTLDSVLDRPALSLPLDETNPIVLQGKIRGYYRTNYTSVDSNNFAVLTADEDLYKVTTNSDLGVIVMELENVPANLKLRIDVIIPDASSSSGYISLGYRDAPDVGQPLTFELLTTFAGVYYIKVRNVNGELNGSVAGNTSASTYTLKVSLDTVICEFNNTPLLACAVNTGETINAKIRGYYRTNFTSVDSNNFVVLTPDVDYYQPNLCNTFTTASVTNVPGNLRMKITAYDETGINTLGSKTALANGAPVAIAATDLINPGAVKYFKIENTVGVNGTNTSPDFYTVQFDCSSLGLETIQPNSGFLVYPNPTRSLLSLQFDANRIVDKITITDLTGKKVMEVTGNKTQVNVENLAKGVYFIDVWTDNGLLREKFVKD